MCFNERFIKHCLELIVKFKIKKFLIKLDNSVCDEIQKKFTVKLAIKIFSTLFQNMNANEVSVKFHCMLIIIDNY